MQRPAYARKQDPGMPSSHASSLAYLAVYLAIAWKPAQPALAITSLLVAAFLVSFYTSASCCLAAWCSMISTRQHYVLHADTS